MIPAATLIFAIQAGVKLYSAGHKVYVDDTRKRDLILPLPEGAPLGIASAETFFTTDPAGVEYAAQIAWLQEIIDSDEEFAGTARKGDILQLYRVAWSESKDETDAEENDFASVSADELGALLAVRQWSRGEAGAPDSGLRVIGGTLLNVAVDYFASQPGAVSTTHPLGRALHGALAGLDKVDFTTVELRQLPGTLLVGILETVSKTPSLLVGGAKERNLVEGIARTLAERARERLVGVDSITELDAATWLNVVAHGVIKGAADTVLAHPELYIQLGSEAETTVANDVAKALAELVVGDEELQFRKLLSTSGINTIARAFLGSVAANPGVVSFGNEGVRKTIKDVAESLSNHDDLLRAELLPEVIRVVLEKSAANAELLAGVDMAVDPGAHLLVKSAKIFFAAVAQPTGDTWRPGLSRSKMIEVFEDIATEVVDNPAWLEEAAAGADKRLGVVVKAVFGALKQTGDKRLSGNAAAAAVSAAVKAVAQNAGLLDGAAGDATETAIAKAVNAVVAPLLGADADWTAARSSAAVALLEQGLAALAKYGAAPAKITALGDVSNKVANGSLSIADLPTALDGALSATEEE